MRFPHGWWKPVEERVLSMSVPQAFFLAIVLIGWLIPPFAEGCTDGWKAYEPEERYYITGSYFRDRCESWPEELWQTLGFTYPAGCRFAELMRTPIKKEPKRTRVCVGDRCMDLIHRR